MEITKTELLEKLTALRAGNIEAMEDEDISDEMLEQEEGIEATFDMVERMLKELPDENTEHIFDPTTAGDVITTIKRNYKPEDKMIAILWGEGDVRGMNKDDDGNGEEDDDFTGTPLTDEQVTNVLASLTHNHDACYGVSWDTIEDTVQFHKDN